MRNGKKTLLAGALILAIIVIAVVLLADSEWLERFAEGRIEARTERSAEIGNIELGIGRCLRVTIEDLRIGNPEWAETKYLIDAQSIRACISWLPLLIGRIAMQEVEVLHAGAGLERDGERATWKFREEEEKGPSRVSARHVSIVDSKVLFRDKAERTSVDVAVSGGIGNDDQLDLSARGELRGAPVRIVAQAPAIKPTPETPLVASAAGILGRTTVAAAGRFTSAGTEGMDLRLDIAGDDLSDFNRLGINLPPTPPYSLRGRLRHSNNEWHFDPFEGRVGDSDLAGQLSYITGGTRPSLHANVAARLLDFDDLGPMVGTPPKTGRGETASPEQKKEGRALDDVAHVLPDKPLGIERWWRMDADVRFRADKVQRPNAIPVNGLRTHFVIKDSALQLQPLEFDVAGGQVTINGTIEGKVNPPRASMSFDVRALDLARMLPKLATQKAAAGILYGNAKVDARGNSIASLASTADGNVVLMMDGGMMSNLLLELMGLDAGEAIRILASRDKAVPVRCGISNLTLEDGVANVKLFVLDTEDTLFTMDGKIDLGEERLDLVLRPQPKDASLLVARTPLVIGGRFNDPSVLPQPGPLVARGAAVVLLGLVNPLLALLPLIETGPGKDSNCAALLAQAHKK